MFGSLRLPNMPGPTYLALSRSGRRDDAGKLNHASRGVAHVESGLFEVPLWNEKNCDGLGKGPHTVETLRALFDRLTETGTAY